MSTLQDRILASLRRNPHLPDWRIAKNLKCRVDDVRATRAGHPDASDIPAEEAPGIKLAGKSVSSRKPVETAAKYIKRLPHGQGFDPAALARQWNMSENTIKDHARQLGCLKFVEVSEDEWKQLVLSPETARLYPT